MTPGEVTEIQRMKDALDLINVRVLDHFVVGGNHASSFAELGLL